MSPETANPLFNAEQFKAFYQTFDNNTPSKLASLYSSDIIFKDPIHKVRGTVALHDYFAGFCNAELDCRFEFVNQIINNEQAFFQWQMHYRHSRLANGKALILDGGSLIKFSSHIYYHEDFYDMGAMIYQHLPVLGWAVKKINARLVSTR